ncbi:flagellar basal body-associated FliL family protein [Rhodobacteraceae bacterium RKSG542]|uniref:flagellar basal body-associated FliL family protein n=1 Tax=Pseudovibrio flavus TaxID=2529854 RepID=UPI0012BD657C|nr:flagellar basal body-associated FliL family protein [Pseudovibrio flavus]MTI16926.1 flagellar basal body-associated FliL family protein [Pseudovibrio flavus]
MSLQEFSAEEPAARKPAPKLASVGALAGAIVFLTALAVGGGYLFASSLVRSVHTQLLEERKAESEEGVINPVYASKSHIFALKPIVTNLLSSSGTWIRIESSLILNSQVVDEEAFAALAKEIEQDLLIYARTLGPRQLEGSRGLLRLRDDLNERATIRGGDAVRELIIESVVLQ